MLFLKRARDFAPPCFGVLLDESYAKFVHDIELDIMEEGAAAEVALCRIVGRSIFSGADDGMGRERLRMSSFVFIAISQWIKKT
jgi:hypothetical protein